MNSPKVSVIIPVYNSEQFIGQTIDSSLNQNYRDFELIVVDDGSHDGTQRAISRYKDRLTYIRKDNEGVSAARNTGIAQAQGEYIAFLDHDDIWLPDKLQEQVALLESNKEVALVFSDAYIIDEKGERDRTLFQICPPHSGMVFKQLLKENFIPILTTVVRKEVFKEIGLFNPHYRIAEDWDLFLKVARRYPVAFVKRPLAEYRVHIGSFSRQRIILLEEAISVINKYMHLVDKVTAILLKMKRYRFQFELGMLYLHKALRGNGRR